MSERPDMDPAVTIRPAEGAADMETARALFREYADWLNVDLCFQGFEQELATLPGAYAPPRGGLWFAVGGVALAGTVGMRPLEGGRCEMKRLWVRPAYRGLGIGRRLAETAVEAGRAAGHRAMCLDTLGFMDGARALYARLGFREIPAYYHNPLEDVRYLELDLDAAPGRARTG